MTKYIVQGGSPLFGEVHISGAKNAAVAILPAALLVHAKSIEITTKQISIAKIVHLDAMRDERFL